AALFRFQRRNRGRVPVPHAPWIIRANGATLATGDTALAGTDSVMIERRLAPTLAPGSYVVRGTAYALAAWRETDESNNGANRTLVVTGPRDGVPPAFMSGPTVTPGSSPIV